ncbi:MAG: hypothetical protein WD397_00670 [Wenzhouxiangellaceae bacterium]
MDNGRYSDQHTLQFTEHRWWEKVFDYLRFLIRQAPLFLAVAASFWAASEIAMEATGNRIPLSYLATFVLLAAAAISASQAFFQYRSYTPETLIGESRRVKAIFRERKCGWQCSLARAMLKDRIEKTEERLERMNRGVAFVPPKHLSLSEYTKWMHQRNEAIVRILRAVASSCTSTLPEALARTIDEQSIGVLKFEVEELSSLYDHAERIERECIEIVPSEGMEELHALTRGWTKPIRDGVLELTKILKQLSEIKRKDIKTGGVELPEFNIQFESPKCISEFTERLQSLDASEIAQQNAQADAG